MDADPRIVAGEKLAYYEISLKLKNLINVGKKPISRDQVLDKLEKSTRKLQINLYETVMSHNPDQSFEENFLEVWMNLCDRFYEDLDDE